TFPLTCNNSTQFDCQTSSDPQRCIPLEWLCDGLKDCKNGLDESHCSYLHTCPEGDFICRSGDCVSSHFKCDGEIDCPGGEDENGCEFLSIFVPSA
ncbi:Low-density lipoprotein receptor domain class A, partial [Teladorsagia circumcincta]